MTDLPDLPGWKSLNEADLAESKRRAEEWQQIQDWHARRRAAEDWQRDRELIEFEEKCLRGQVDE